MASLSQGRIAPMDGLVAEVAPRLPGSRSQLGTTGFVKNISKGGIILPPPSSPYTTWTAQDAYRTTTSVSFDHPGAHAPHPPRNAGACWVPDYCASSSRIFISDERFCLFQASEPATSLARVLSYRLQGSHRHSRALSRPSTASQSLTWTSKGSTRRSRSCSRGETRITTTRPPSR